jgi:dTDP-4-dehydrorhamnose reductase
MRIAVVGARGQLGAAVVHECRDRHEAIAFDRAALDLTDDTAVAAAMEKARPDVIVNCAAYNDVDGAEDHALEALSVNAFAVRALARAASATDATLVHYSSDFVFDGRRASRTAKTTRQIREARTRRQLLGEWFAADAPRAAYAAARRACSAARRRDRRQGGQRRGILRALAAGRKRVSSRSHRVADSHHRRRPRR